MQTDIKYQSKREIANTLGISGSLVDYNISKGYFNSKFEDGRRMIDVASAKEHMKNKKKYKKRKVVSMDLDSPLGTVAEQTVHATPMVAIAFVPASQLKTTLEMFLK